MLPASSKMMQIFLVWLMMIKSLVIVKCVVVRTFRVWGMKLIQSPTHFICKISALMKKGEKKRLELELLGLLPGEFLVGEVTVLSGLEVDGVAEVELLVDDTWAEVEVVLDNLDELVRGAL